MEIEHPFQGGVSSVAVTVMRRGEKFGALPVELKDGNMLPKLCQAAGELACIEACQRQGEAREKEGLRCSEYNISTVLEHFEVRPENFVLVSAAEDNVFFGDALEDTKAVQSTEKYTFLPSANAFFFRPGIDRTPAGESIDVIAMRMADCGSVSYEFTDRNKDVVLGQAHFSRTNMFGPSAFAHDIGDERVSWGEFVLGNALEHYGADPKTVRINLAAAIEGKDFVQQHDDVQTLFDRWPGWDELNFLHQGVGKHAEDKYLPDYREMIEWQLRRAADRFGVEQKMRVRYAINTGNRKLGHASHHWASKGEIAQGRDLYFVGVRVGQLVTKARRLLEEASHFYEMDRLYDSEVRKADAERLIRILGDRFPVEERTA